MDKSVQFPVPATGGKKGECSTTTSPVLGPEWCGQEFGNRAAEAVGRSVMTELFSEEGQSLIIGELCE